MDGGSPANNIPGRSNAIEFFLLEPAFFSAFTEQPPLGQPDSHLPLEVIGVVHSRNLQNLFNIPMPKPLPCVLIVGLQGGGDAIAARDDAGAGAPAGARAQEESRCGGHWEAKLKWPEVAGLKCLCWSRQATCLNCFQNGLK